MAELGDLGTQPLHALRLKRSVSRAEVAEKSDVPEATLQRWESGVGHPRREVLARVLTALDATASETYQVLEYFRRPSRDRESLASIRQTRQENTQVNLGAVRIERPVDRIVAILPASQSGRPDPTPITTPVELAEALNAVHIWAGTPSLRTLQDASNGILRRATISDMLNTKKVEETQRIPDLDRCIAFVKLCGIRDVEEWVSAWRRLKARQRPQAGGWLKV
ncbi:helix-turn-helix transcriptional regulator [Streptomyces sp. NBC_01546]|uniref:helix-turn-helix domain-containing protein n=1 Tax=Streptomyces sp. NBC_01546 TaxID=2975872 RepID=UPI002F90A21E